MPRMIDLIKQSGVPANVMRSASKGALALPAARDDRDPGVPGLYAAVR